MRESTAGKGDRILYFRTAVNWNGSAVSVDLMSFILVVKGKADTNSG